MLGNHEGFVLSRSDQALPARFGASSSKSWPQSIAPGSIHLGHAVLVAGPESPGARLVAAFAFEVAGGEPDVVRGAGFIDATLRHDRAPGRPVGTDHMVGGPIPGT